MFVDREDVFSTGELLSSCSSDLDYWNTENVSTCSGVFFLIPSHCILNVGFLQFEEKVGGGFIPLCAFSLFLFL